MNLLISSIFVGVLLIVMIIGFERAKPRPRDLMPVVVLAALAVLGRVITMPIPNFQPATALIVLAGLFFGKHAGLLCGMLVALVSNMFMGQGPWTLWQMMAWGLVGYGSGLLGQQISASFANSSSDTGLDPLTSDKSMNSLTSTAPIAQRSLAFQIIVIVYGAVASLLFGAFQDLQFFIAFTAEAGWPGLIATLSMGLPLNLIHAASTLIFLLLVLIPWGKKLHRLRIKYGIRSI